MMNNGKTHWGTILFGIILLAGLWFLWGNKSLDKNRKSDGLRGSLDLGNIEMPNIDANIPDVNLPDVDLSLADVDVNLPEIDLSLTPSWYSYLQDNDFQNNNTDYSEFDSDEVLTRSSVTPYLWRYAQINGITQDSTADCSFPDIADVVNALQISIKTVCEYGLLRGSNGNFMPEQEMKKYEVLAVLVRSKVGLIEETTPWYVSYINKAREMNIVGADLTDEQLMETVTKKDLGEWLYQVSLID